MTIQTPIEAAKQPFTEAYYQLSDREALRLLKALADRFSGLGYAYDRMDAGIEACATELAEQEGYRGDDLVHRYLHNPDRFGPRYNSVVMVNISGAQMHKGGLCGG